MNIGSQQDVPPYVAQGAPKVNFNVGPSKKMKRILAIFAGFTCLVGCAHFKTATVNPMPPTAQPTDGAVIAATGKYLRDLNEAPWKPYEEESSPVALYSMTPGKLTDEVIASSLQEKTRQDFRLNFSKGLIAELQTRNPAHISLGDCIPHNTALLVTNTVVEPWLMDGYRTGRIGYFAPFLPAYFDQTNSAIMVAWIGPSEHGGLGAFYLRRVNNEWSVHKALLHWFM